MGLCIHRRLLHHCYGSDRQVQRDSYKGICSCFRGLFISLCYGVRQGILLFLTSSAANLHSLSYGSMVDVNQFTIISEIFPSHIRGEAASISIGSLLLVDVLWLELQPVANRTIGWKYYILFVAMGIAHLVYFYFFLPEVSGSFSSRRHCTGPPLVTSGSRDTNHWNLSDLRCGPRGAGPSLWGAEHRRLHT